MSDDVKPKPAWPRRIFWALAIILILAVFSLLALRVFITTQSGARFIENQINKRSFGPIERLEVSGLSGDPLDALALKSVRIYDKDGIWLSADNIALDWNPWALRQKTLDLKSLTVAQSELIRRPKLNAGAPSSGDPVSVRLETGRVEALILNESVMGQRAVLGLSGKFTKQKNGAVTAKLDAVRSDAGGDAVALDFTRQSAGDMAGTFNLTGAAGGTLAALLRAPAGTKLTGTGRLSGDTDTGQGNIIISFNDAPKVTAKGNWTQDAANLQANVDTTSWALFDKARRGLGDAVDITAALNRSSRPQAFNVAVKSDRLTARARGNLNPDGGLPETANVTANSDKMGAFFSLPEGLSLGAGNLDGAVTLSPKYAFDGKIGLSDIVTPQANAAGLEGPVKLRQSADNIYEIDAKLIADTVVSQTELPVAFAQITQITGKARLNTQTGRADRITLSLTSGENRVTVSGAVNYSLPDYDLTGEVAADIKAMGALPAGRLQSDFALKKIASSLLAVSAAGGFKPGAAIAPPFDALLDGGVNFDVTMSPTEAGLRISEASLTGQNIRAALSGSVTEQIDIDGEALLSAPFAYPPVSLTGETAASFKITGARTDPNIRLDARADQVDINGYGLEGARLRADLSDIMNAPKGPLRLTAETKQGALDVSAEFASRESVYAAEDINMTWGRLTAAGALSKPVDGPATGEVRLSLPEKDNQYARAKLALSANGQNQGIAFEAEAKNIAYNEFALDTLSAGAQGTLSSLEGKIDLKGRRQADVIERQFRLSTPFSFTRTDEGGYQASLNPDANYGNLVVDAGPPIQAEYNAGDIKLNAPLTLAGSPVKIDYTKISGAETFAVKASGLPITLIPMPGNLADTRGRIGADFKLESETGSSGVKGGGTVTLTDWRGFDIKPETGLSGDMNITLSSDKLEWKVDAKSSQGFTASGGGYVPILNSQSLASIRPNMSAPLAGQFNAVGEAAAILSLAAPGDVQPSGRVKADLTLSGTASDPLIDGQVSGSRINMEAPQHGTRLSNGRFTANFTNDTLEVNDVFVADSGEGTVTGQGRFKLGEFGRPIGELNMKAVKFRALDRRDFEGSVSGTLGFSSTQDKATLKGDVTLNRAEVKQFVTGGASVVEIPVEEINKPEGLDPIEIKAPASPINLDVRLRAPRRIFVRSRGLDVELSVDATIKGTLAAPEVYGSADVLRGGYKIAGKELAFETGGIKFDGELEKARVNLVANTKTQNMSASVNITGTVAEPQIELSSSPDRPQDEILSALLFGRSATELSTIEAAQLAGALAQFSGAGGGFDLLGGLRDALGVGQLSIGLGEDGGAQITGGRYLAKNVYLQVFSGGGTGQTGAVIEWELRENVSLRSQIQADNDQSFTLRWKRDY